MSSTSEVKCMKCFCILSEDSLDLLCDNCNMDLIAQNFAAEMSQHEVHCDDQSPQSVEIVEYEDPKPNEPEVEKESVTKIKDDLVEDSNVIKPTQSDVYPETKSISNKEVSMRPENEFIKDGLEPSKSESGSSSEDLVKCEKETNNTGSKVLNAMKTEIEPSLTPTTPSKIIERRTSSNNDRKRKLDDNFEMTPEKKANTEEDNKDESSSSSDESESRHVRVEPMRTRAKVVQEEAAAQTHHKGCDDDRLGDDDGEEDDGPVPRLTRKALAEIEKYKHPCYEPAQSKSRRTKTFKSKPVYKAPTSQASIYSSDYVFYKGKYYQSGDIVVLRDTKRPGDFYAQITSFLTDQYCHKCATIQWLFPTKQSPPSGFDPRTYILGYLDEIPRPLAALQPVMHLPSDYYRFNKNPYPPPTPDPLKKHYLWKRTEPVNLEAMLQGQDCP